MKNLLILILLLSSFAYGDKYIQEKDISYVLENSLKVLHKYNIDKEVLNSEISKVFTETFALGYITALRDYNKIPIEKCSNIEVLKYLDYLEEKNSTNTRYLYTKAFNEVCGIKPPN